MIKIVVLDKGFVSVGVFTEGDTWCTLENASVIRRWGSERGLGQIAEDGPTDYTVLDKTPKQRFPVRSIVKTIDCNQENWRKALGL